MTGEGAVERWPSTDPTSPKLITTWKPGISNVHGMSISEDGTRGYFVSLGFTSPTGLTDATVPATNGLLIYDLTEIQRRQPNPQPHLLETFKLSRDSRFVDKLMDIVGPYLSRQTKRWCRA